MINFFLDWIWGLPQNLIGFLYWLFCYECNFRLKIENIDANIYISYQNGCVSLGRFIFINKKYAERISNEELEKTIYHEYGHTIQSRILGPFYLLVIGIPSALWLLIRRLFFKNVPYEKFYTEKWADKLGFLSKN